MPANKKHHYVPQFYLKFFSNDTDCKFINTFNLKSSKIINNVPINTQSYKDYYYGKNSKTEHALGDLENFAVDIIKNISHTKKLPKKTSNEYMRLLLYINIQKNRTVAAGDEYNQFIDRYYKQLIKIHPELNTTITDLDNIRIEESEPSNTALALACESFPYLMDLEPKLFINETKIPFITSDNPVTSYNILTEKIKYPYNGCSILSKGLKIFFPVSPYICIVLYDRIVYKIGQKLSTSLTIDENGVKNLNKLQLLNSCKNIFFNNNLNSQLILNWFNSIKNKRTTSKVKYKEIKITETKILTRTSIKDIRANLDFNFIKCTDHAKKFKWDGRMYLVRDEKMLERLS